MNAHVTIEMTAKANQTIIFIYVVTNDGATILSQIEIKHPAAKILVELAQTQDEAVGDGTTSVVILAAELMKVQIY